MNVNVQQNFIAAPPAAALPLAAAAGQPAMAASAAAVPMLGAPLPVTNAAPMAFSGLGMQLQALAAALPADSEQLKTIKLALLSGIYLGQGDVGRYWLRQLLNAPGACSAAWLRLQHRLVVACMQDAELAWLERLWHACWLARRAFGTGAVAWACGVPGLCQLADAGEL